MHKGQSSARQNRINQPLALITRRILWREMEGRREEEGFRVAPAPSLLEGVIVYL